uniref:AB hydrolase-1 domain-containing protein n=1 Tax=Graphocephala atropunctata TaxID=36148 RepID=A0A1B6KVN5_9HEMI
MVLWYFGSLFGAAFFITYYIRNVVQRPLLLNSSGKFRKFLENNVSLTKRKFWPTVWCFESRAQTVISSLVRGQVLPDIQYTREILQLKDGGEVALDWRFPLTATEETPVVVILPGLTGGSQTDYVKGLVLQCHKTRIRAVVFNNRGIGGITLKTPRTYCGSNFEDLSEVLEHVNVRFPAALVGAVGISMGGLILGNYLAGKGEEATKHLSAAMLISVPWDVFKGTESIEKPILNRLLNYHLAGCLCKVLAGVREVVEPAGLGNIDNCLKSSSIREFDSNFTSKQFGYKDVTDYYNHATLHNKLHKICLPTLCLSAGDDPFQPFEAIPVDAANNSDHVAIVVTARGGHIGFMEGLWPFHQNQYMFELFAQFFESMFYRNGYKLLNSYKLEERID